MRLFRSGKIAKVRFDSLYLRVSCVLLCAALAASAQAQTTRGAAFAAADWAIDTENAPALADAIVILLKSGSVLEPNDPYSVAPLVGVLKALEGGASLADQLASLSRRGQIGGAPRRDIVLMQGETYREDIQVAPDEAAFVEARLKRFSGAADTDLRLFWENGALIEEDLGPETGVLGVGNYLEFWPEACASVRIELTNRGQGTGYVAILVPQSRQDACPE